VIARASPRARAARPRLQQTTCKRANYYYTNRGRTCPRTSIRENETMTDRKSVHSRVVRAPAVVLGRTCMLAFAARRATAPQFDSVMFRSCKRAPVLGGEGDINNGARPGGQPVGLRRASLVDSLVKEAGPPAAISVRFSDRARKDARSEGQRDLAVLRAASKRNCPIDKLESSDPRAAANAPPVPEIDAYLWVRVPSVPESRLRRWYQRARNTKGRRTFRRPFVLCGGRSELISPKENVAAVLFLRRCGCCRVTARARAASSARHSGSRFNKPDLPPPRLPPTL
jgi:hypothetical protein